MVYPNLEIQMEQRCITKADLAVVIGERPETVADWMDGRDGDFNIHDAFVVREAYFPDCDIQYLFASQSPSETGCMLLSA